MADRVVQAALKLVLEPIFEADFVPVSYGFRPLRRAHDAIAETHLFGTHDYRWVLDADIEACFYTFIGDRPIRSVKAKVRDLTPRTSQQDPAAVLTRLGQILRGWSAYFRHASAKTTFRRLAHLVWNRVARWLRTLHRWTWAQFRRRFTTTWGRWNPLSVDGVALFDLGTVAVTRYRYRAQRSPHRGRSCRNQPDGKRPWRARCLETGTPGSASGLGRRTGAQPRHRAPGRLNSAAGSRCPNVLGPRRRGWLAVPRRGRRR